MGDYTLHFYMHDNFPQCLHYYYLQSQTTGHKKIYFECVALILIGYNSFQNMETKGVSNDIDVES